MNLRAERCHVVLYACFIDFQKAFDRVKHTVLIDDLRNLDMNGKVVRVIKKCSLESNRISSSR